MSGNSSEGLQPQESACAPVPAAVKDFFTSQVIIGVKRIHTANRELDASLCGRKSTPHFLAPNAKVFAGNFLDITSANMDQRQFRIVLKLMF